MINFYKKSTHSLAIFLLSTLLAFSCFSSINASSTTTALTPKATTIQEAKIKSIKLEISSRKTKIPAVITLPENFEKSKKATSFVIFAHGHGGSKDENGGFTAIAEELAKNNIASIRIDFPGCGDSKESFEKNTLLNMTEDLNSAYNYITKNYSANINPKKIGLLGYSMGGRLAVELASSSKKFSSIALLAPAIDSGENIIKLLSQNKDDAQYKLASKNGFVEITTMYGQKQKLSKAWFDELRASKPLDNTNNYSGNVLVIYGDKDDVVSPIFSLATAGSFVNSASNVKTYKIIGADHGYGFYDEKQSSIKQEVVSEINNFFVNKLK